MAGRDLVAAARSGDAWAFAVLLDPLWVPGYRLAFSMLREREAAEDAVQEAALKAWKSVRRLRSDTSSLRPWFLTIVANQCRSTRRNRWWSVVRSDQMVPASGLHGVTAEERLDLVDVMKRLPGDLRLALALRYYLDLPMDEVAAVLRISLPAAKSRVRRALKALAPALRPEDVEK
jgi:RNA polymerase sigma factor (sigma-70 family)